MNQPSSPVKIQMIEGSLRCYRLGMLAFLPAIGLVMAVMAEGQGWRVRRLSAGRWNPAEHYLNRGIAFARTGLALLLLEAVLVAAIVIAHTNN